MYASQWRRSRTSPRENFQCFSGFSSRARKRFRCSVRRQVQEELPDDHAVAGEIPLEGVDVLEPFPPDSGGDERRWQTLPGEHLGMDPDDEHLLVVGAVEDADPAALGEATRRAPEEVVVELLVGGRLERVHLDALRIHPRHDVLDRAVLPGGVHALEDQEQRPAILGVELLLELAERLDLAVEALAGLRLGRDASRVPGIDRRQTEAPSVRDLKGADEAAGLAHEVSPSCASGMGARGPRPRPGGRRAPMVS